MKMGQQRRLLASSRHAADDRPRHRHARHAVASRHHRCVRDAALRRQRRDARGRAGADGRRVRRDRARRGAAAQGDGANSRVNILLLSLLISGDHRDAGLSRAALPVRAADAPHHRQHGGVPRATRRIPARIIARVGPPRRDRHRRARACRHAARPRLDAAAEEPSRRARARGVEDQPRPAQPARLGAAVLRPAGAACPIRTCSASRPS